MGYSNIKVFAAGYPAWKKYAGASAAAAAPIQKGAEEGSIAIKQFNDIIENRPDSIYLVDVRDKDEYINGHIKSAVNIPVDELENRVKTLPADKPIVFICSTGARSGESFYMLQDLRPDLKKVYYLEAACTFRKDGSYNVKTLQ